MCVFNKIIWNKTKKDIKKKIQLGLRQDTHNLYKANKYIFYKLIFFSFTKYLKQASLD